MRKILFLVAVLSSSSGWASLNAKQSTMLETLEQIISVFSEEYAPFEYKVKSANYDLVKEAAAARSKIETNPGITTAEFQDILTDFVSATRDFHVAVSFLSTETATLPFQVMGTQNRYFVVYIDRKKLPSGFMPDLEVGSEILELGGRPIADAGRELVPERYKEPSATELRIAEIYLTNRQRHLGMNVPSGEVMIKIKNRAGQTRDLPFVWEYTPEFVPNDIPLRNMLLPPTKPAETPMIPSPHKDLLSQALGISGPGFVPQLGPVLGVSNSESFNSYLFRLPKGKVVGYIRIPSFEVKNPAADADTFAKIIESSRETTDGLVIDLTHNGGGSFYYMAALLSHLGPSPLKMLPQRIMVSQTMAANSAQRVAFANLYGSEEDFHKMMGPNIEGFALNWEFYQSLISNDRFILSEVRAGRRLTNPTYQDGISYISPTSVHYDKPVLLLIDELDFSCADFFAAILQDNKRVTTFGARTAGAGGEVKEINFLNQFGVDKLRYTVTMAQRIDGSTLEGVGVSPDTPYEFSIRDLTDGFGDYKDAVVNALEAMLK